VHKKLLVVNQYYYPDLASTGKIAAEICKGLVKAGWVIDVITAHPNYSKSSPEAKNYEKNNGIVIHRLSLGKIKGRDKFITRILGYTIFLIKAFFFFFYLAKNNNYTNIMTFHNPPFVCLIGKFIARWFNLKYMYVLFDINPDILIATKWFHLPNFIFSIWDKVHRWILKRANSIIVLGEKMKETLVHMKNVNPEKIHIIPLWGLPELSPASQKNYLREELKIGEDELLLLYSGNMGIMHPLDIILDGASELKESPVRFVFIGKKKKRKYLINRVKQDNIANVIFLPFQPEDRFIQFVNTADACFVTLKPGLEKFALPSRAFTFLSAGCPLITIMDPNADIAQLVVNNGCGWNVTNGQELLVLITHLLRRPDVLKKSGFKAREIYEKKFKKSIIIKEYEKILEKN